MSNDENLLASCDDSGNIVIYNVRDNVDGVVTSEVRLVGSVFGTLKAHENVRY
jgi:hypothetical protein